MRQIEFWLGGHGRFRQIVFCVIGCLKEGGLKKLDGSSRSFIDKNQFGDLPTGMDDAGVIPAIDGDDLALSDDEARSATMVGNSRQGIGR